MMERALAILALLGAVAPVAASAQCLPQPVSGAEHQVFQDMLAGQFGASEAIAMAAASPEAACWDDPLLFCPACLLTRAQLAVFIVGAAGWDLVDPETPSFDDVPVSSPYYEVIETMVSHGVGGGCDSAMYCPNGSVTRGHLALFLASAFITPIPPAPPPPETFSDVPSDNYLYQVIEAVADVCEQAGCSASEFCPGARVTRAEAVVLVAQLSGLWSSTECLAYDPDPPSPGGGAGSGGCRAVSGAAGVLLMPLALLPLRRRNRR